MTAENRSQPHAHSLLNARLVVVLLLSFSSGLPLALLGSTLQAWYTVSGVGLFTIGTLTLVGQPYVYKFLWAPILDRFALLGLGRRRGWIVTMQILLVIGLVIMAFLTPDSHPWGLAWIALMVACFSASQDIAIDAYRTDILPASERGLGAAYNTFGYRIAVLVSGAIALILAAEVGWQFTYLTMAGLILLETIVTLLAPPPAPITGLPNTMTKAVTEPIRDFMRREKSLALLVFIVIYKLSDAFALSLNTPFLIRGLCFDLLEIGTIYKVTALTATLAGSLVGGLLIRRLGIYRSLLYFGLLQALSNLSYMALAIVGKNYLLMTAGVFTEFFCGGLSTVAFVSFLMSLCNRKYTATQYALFSALSAVGRVFAGPEAAAMVEHMGWALFYFSTFLIGIPTLFLLWWLRHSLYPAAEQIT